MKTRKYQPLSVTVGVITAAVIAGAMLVYALGQYLFQPDRSLWALLLHHIWHVAVLSGMTYVVLRWLLDKKVVKPVQQLYTALYRISKGDEEKVVIDTHIKEIQDIAESVNLMLTQLQLSSHEPWVEKLHLRAAELRALGGKVSQTLGEPDIQMLGQTASDLDELALLIERFEAGTQHIVPRHGY